MFPVHLRICCVTVASSELLSHEASPVPGQLLVRVLVLAELGSPLQVLQDGISSLR